MATDIKPKDYIVANYDDKPRLIRVLRVTDDTVHGKWEYKDQETAVEVSFKSIRANLGPHPHIGKVYGASTERLIDVDELEPFVHVEWFFEAQNEEKEAVFSGVQKGLNLLKKHDLLNVIRVCKLRVVLNTAKTITGKTMIGTYRSRDATNDNPDEITIRFHDKVIKQIPYLIAHEAAHAVWHRLLAPALRAEWISSFHSRATITWYDEEQIHETITAMVRQQNAFPMDEEYMAGASEWILSYIKQATGIRPKDIQFLLTHDIKRAKAILGPWRTGLSLPVGE